MVQICKNLNENSAIIVGNAGSRFALYLKRNYLFNIWKSIVSKISFSKSEFVIKNDDQFSLHTFEEEGVN